MEKLGQMFEADLMTLNVNQFEYVAVLAARSLKTLKS